MSVERALRRWATHPNAYMQNLLELPSPSFSILPSQGFEWTQNPDLGWCSFTSHSLRTFYNSMESSIRRLKSLGQSQDSFGSLLIPTIPIEMRKYMNRERGRKSWDIRSLRTISKEMYVEESNSAESYTGVEYTPTVSFVTGAMSKHGKSQRKVSEPQSH